MKKRIQLFCLGLSLVFLSGYGQSFSVEDEIAKLSNAPQTPEASAFMTYGDTKVNLYSGVPDISVPIHTIKGKEMDLPINLAYDATGIKVNDLASWVGLGWNLNAGGRITRVVNGLADDFNEGQYQSIRNAAIKDKVLKFFGPNSTYNLFDDQADAEEYLDFLKGIQTGCIDAEPDYYYLNANGVSEEIVLDYNDNYKPKAINNPRIKFFTNESGTNVINGWLVTLDDGTKLEFLQAEETRIEGVDREYLCNVINRYNSSWVLTKIISPNGKDTYNFTYHSFPLWQEPQYCNESVMATNATDPENPNSGWQGTNAHEVVNENKISQRFLKTISHNSKIVFETFLGNRQDIDINSALENIKIYNRNAVVLKEFDFTYTYFGSGSDPSDIRLKLDKVDKKGSDANVYETYSFDYISPASVPSRESKSRDYWGLYNGASNTVSYPQHSSLPGGANREPSSYHAKIGLLNKITYPTKGYSEFLYEPHDVYKGTTNTQTQYIKQMSLDDQETNDGSLMYDGGVLCDDVFLSGSGVPPKVEIESFTITEAGIYNVSYTGNNSYSRAALAFVAPIDPDDCSVTPNGQTICASPPGYETYCDFLNSNPEWFPESITKEVVLEQGVYSVALVYKRNSSATTSFSVTREVETGSAQNVVVGGVRIKSIKNRDHTTELLTEKRFVYRDSLDKSTGIENYKPFYVNFVFYEAFKSDGTLGIMEEAYRQAAMPTGDQPHVVYRSVQEILVDHQNNTNGKTVYGFYTDKKGAVPMGSPPFENRFLGSVKGSKVKEKKIKSNSELLQEEYNEYEEYNALSSTIRGVAVERNAWHSDKAIGLYQHSNGKISIELLSHPVGGGPFNMTDATVTCSNLGSNNFVACRFNDGSFSYATAQPRLTIVSGKIGGVSKTIREEYFNGQKVETETLTTFDPTVDYLVRDQQSKNSFDEFEKVIKYYPKDNVVVNSPALVTANRLTEVVKTEAQVNSNTVFTRHTDYQLVGLNKVLPQFITTEKANAIEEERVEVRFYLNGNIKEVQQPDGTITTYLWGYEHQYMVAQINNITYSSIPSSLVTAITSASSSSGSESQLLTALTNLRNDPALSNAMMTSYTYKPQVGVSTITDAKEDKISYYYDPFGRLEFVKDKDGNMLSENEYHYKNQ